ncbi:MAG: FHA domain-containing protein [Candidatus Azobacteroides sp.]|nr:FHA domain-containing protein [Candidatus Azobacteroides sp.]
MKQCPHCQKEGTVTNNNTETLINEVNDGVTREYKELDNKNTGGHTEIIEDARNPRKASSFKTNMPNKISSSKANIPVNNLTVFEDEIEVVDESGGVVVKKERRTNRKLVGWLVTYSIDPLGIDYKIYEGRNMIGKHVDCDITVNDNKMTDKHALILFRTDEYVIQDQLSTHGTFVNEGDIRYDPFTLHDGDIIRMGETVFLFRTSII